MTQCNTYNTNQKSHDKGTLHSKLALAFFTRPKSIYLCDFSHKLHICKIRNRWLYRGTDDTVKAKLKYL